MILPAPFVNLNILSNPGMAQEYNEKYSEEKKFVIYVYQYMFGFTPKYQTIDSKNYKGSHMFNKYSTKPH